MASQAWALGACSGQNSRVGTARPTVAVAGIVRTDVAQRLSLLLSLLAAFVFFGQTATALKLLGLGLGLVAMLGISLRPLDSEPPRMKPALRPHYVREGLFEFNPQRHDFHGEWNYTIAPWAKPEDINWKMWLELKFFSARQVAPPRFHKVVPIF